MTIVDTQAEIEAPVVDEAREEYYRAKQVLMDLANRWLVSAISYAEWTEVTRKRVCSLIEASTVILHGLLTDRTHLEQASMFSVDLMGILVRAATENLVCRKIELRISVDEKEREDFDIAAHLVTGSLDLNCIACFGPEEQVKRMANLFGDPLPQEPDLQET